MRDGYTRMLACNAATSVDAGASRIEFESWITLQAYSEELGEDDFEQAVRDLVLTQLRQAGLPKPPVGSAGAKWLQAIFSERLGP